MKNKFHGYYKPSKEEFTSLWDNSLLVVDANVLLNLYTYSTETWDEILRLLEDLKDRVWLPYQAGYEYHRNRCGIVVKEARRYADITRDLRTVRDNLGARKRHPFINAKLFETFAQLVQQIEEALDSGKKSHDGFVRDDPIRDRITQIFDGRVGDQLTEQQLNELYVEGANRYAKKIPPGYQDEKKPEPDRYGDFVLWKELIQRASETQTTMIFVTDDRKDDWWLIVDDETVGPRPELLHEFRKETKQDLYIYGSDLFFEIAKERGKNISERAVEELEAAANQRKKEADSQRLSAEEALGLSARFAAEEALRKAGIGSLGLSARFAAEEALRKAGIGSLGLSARFAAEEALRKAGIGSLGLSAEEALRKAGIGSSVFKAAEVAAQSEMLRKMLGPTDEQAGEPEHPEEDAP